MIRKSKKGVTLVELVICCAIIVMLGGACTAVLVGGQNLFNKGSTAANSQLDADVLQAYLMNELPRTRYIGAAAPGNDTEITDYGCLFFDEENDGVFTFRANGKNTTIEAIKGFTWSIVQAGSKETARPQFQFTATLEDGSTLSGGYVLISMAYDATAGWADTSSGTVNVFDLKDFPFYFSSQAPAEPSASPSPSAAPAS